MRRYRLMETKKALITGITGQDGAYLAEFLLNKGYCVYGIKRRSSLFNTGRIDHLYEDPHVENSKFHLFYGDLTDAANLLRIIQQVQPDEIYNLAAQSHVQVSFSIRRNTRQTQTLLVHCAFLRPCVFLPLKKRQNSTRHQLASCSAGTGDATEGNNTFLSKKSIRCGKALCLLDNNQLP